MERTAKVIDKQNPLYGMLCTVGPLVEKSDVHYITAVDEPWHSSYARDNQLEFVDEEKPMDKLQQLREALEQQRAYERENWPFVDDEGNPTSVGESITYHLDSLYCWSPGYVMTLPPEERDKRLQEIWQAFSLAGDIIERYEKATLALLKGEK